MPKFFLIFFSLFIIHYSLFIPPALAYSSPGSPTGFVNDYAGILNADQKTTLENKLTQFEKDSSNEISVAIIKNLGGDTIENFAVELFKDWGIGKKNKDNGVLVLIAIEDKKMRIEVGYGLEGALTDAQSSWIINQQMKPAFQASDYNQGITEAVDKIIAATQGEYIPEDTANSSSGSGLSFGNWFWIIVFIPMWLASILGRSKSWWAGGMIGGIGGIVIGIFMGFLYLGIISIAVLIPLGLLFDYIVSSKYQKSKASGIVPWWIGGGRGGSGFGGGGGFGGFGGGSSGGGGASGGW